MRKLGYFHRGISCIFGKSIFDIREKGTIVVVGDIVPDSRVEDGPGLSVPIPATIAGGTGNFKGISGFAIITERLHDSRRALFLDVVLDMMHHTSLP